MIKKTIMLTVSTLAMFAAMPATAQEPGFQGLQFKSADQEIAAAEAKARKAIKECDWDSFDDAMEWLDDIAYDVSDTKADKIEDLMDDLEDEWESPPATPCGNASLGSRIRMISLTASIGRLKFADSPYYLGKENGGNINTLRFLQPDESGTYYGLGGEMRMGLRNMAKIANFMNWPNTSKKQRSNLDFYLGANYSTTSIDKGYTNVGTGGDILLIPGVGVGPNGAGFSLAFAGGLNEISSARYDSEYDKWSIGLGLGKTLQYGNKELRTFGGLEYSYHDSNQNLSGSIPGFGRDFAYDTDIQNHVIGPVIGLESKYDIRRANAQGPGVQLYGKANYKIGYNFADGDDSLAFTGFNTQETGIDKTTFTQDFGIGTGIIFNPDGPFNLSLGVDYQRIGNLPIVMRDGVGRSQLKFEQGDVYRGMARMSYSFR